MDFNEIYTLLVVIEKAAAHGTRYAAIISAAQASLDEIITSHQTSLEAQPQEEEHG